ncbi:MAG: hypothetical protein A2729_01575 [Candidatus Buchananbacteria bacterium RIFCSPHIGHO2_01_FULL_39_14]|uniref:Ureidoglycolate hydrolase n=1 Tax=Candidatus Buchananbacteria bacterium RIFCSPHIGHO2_01_FULL_39_14 TaxID=1797532 RepID=A0A1G1XWW6_9BACT|nr:MAG: hypothetical protein A2729_01575 [Candidatus Buchananbacteria bacterium RIFCSPHIGHO2_01_FULL_39_14]
MGQETEGNKMKRQVVKLPVQLATMESFAPYGRVIDPERDRLTATEILGSSAVGFRYYPQGKDRTLNLKGEKFVWSLLEVYSRPCWVKDSMEFHRSHEVLTFFNRVVFVAGPKAPKSGKFEDLPTDGWAAFVVGKGCSVVLNPRTLHTLPFPWSNRKVSVMVMLPFEGHKNDCQFVNFPEGFVLRPKMPTFFSGKTRFVRVV